MLSLNLLQHFNPSTLTESVSFVNFFGSGPLKYRDLCSVNNNYNSTMLTLINSPTHCNTFVNKSHLIQFRSGNSNKLQHLVIHFRFQTHATFMSPLSVFSIHGLQIARSSVAYLWFIECDLVQWKQGLLRLTWIHLHSCIVFFAYDPCLHTWTVHGLQRNQKGIFSVLCWQLMGAWVWHARWLARQVWIIAVGL